MATTRDEARQRKDAERLADIFTGLQRKFMLNLSKELNRGNISFAQYFLLSFLAQKSEFTMTEIANKMGHTTAAATGLVDRLENLGHVKRVHAKDDRRKIFVQITASGSQIVTEVRDDMVGNVLKMMEHLDADEQHSWLRIYEKIFTYCQCS
jgi:DNA-binding MarR family transcriptional regulator